MKPLDQMVLDKQNLWKIVIPPKRRTGIRWMLHCLGIGRDTLFPGLDSLGNQLEWKHRRVHQTEYLAGFDLVPPGE